MIYIFDRDENLLEVITEYEECKTTKKLNSERSCSFTITKNKNIKRYNKVGLLKDNEFQLFFIDDFTSFKDSENEKVTVECLADLYNLSNSIIDDKRATTINEAITKALEGSNYKVGTVESFENRDINFYHISRLKALNEIIKTFKCEFDVRIEINLSTGKIDNKFIDLKHRLGEDTGIRFTYDTALESVEKSIVTEGHFNVLYGFGKALQTEGGGYSRKLNFADINNNKKYVEDLESISRYGRLEGIFEDGNIEDKTILLKATKEKLETTKDLKMSYKASIKDISKLSGFEHFKVNLGDTIIILDEEVGDIVEARIIAIEEVKTYDSEDIILTLGNFINGLSDDTLEDSLNDLNDKVDNIKPDISIDPDTIFPDTLPSIPIVEATGLFSSVILSWTYENKNYYSYELFASKIKDFNPTADNKIFEGKASSFLHEVKPSETWYYRCRAKNTYDNTTDYSLQVEATTRKIADGTEWFEELAITHALIGSLDADKITVGKLKAQFLELYNLLLTDGNGKETLRIDDFGRVYMDVTNLKINSESVTTDSKLQEALNKYKEIVDKEFTDVSTSIKNLETLSNDIFFDNVVTVAEKEALKKQKAILEKEHKDILGQVEALEIVQELLNTTEKTNLLAKKAELVAAYNKVIAEIDKVTTRQIKASFSTTGNNFNVTSNDCRIAYTSSDPLRSAQAKLNGATWTKVKFDSTHIIIENSLLKDGENVITHFSIGFTTTPIGTQEARRIVINKGGEIPPSDINPTGITVNYQENIMNIGQAMILEATVLPSNASDKSIEFSSSDNRIITIGHDGFAVAQSAGSARLTARTVNGLEAHCQITVRSSEPTEILPTAISLNKTSITKTIGETETLIATITPSNSTNKTITWTSNNTSVATVLNGVVTAKTVGTTTITARTHNDLSAACRVSVEDTLPPIPPVDGSLLEQALNQYEGTLKQLRILMQKCVDKIAAAKVSVVDGKYEKRCSSIEQTANGITHKVDKIEQDMVTDTAIIEAINNYKKEVDKQFSDVNSAHNSLENTMNGAFADGIIDEAESLAINERLIQIEKEHSDVNAEYLVIYHHISLTGAPKTNLFDKKNGFDIHYNNLRNTIIAAMSDKKITATEQNDIKTKTQTYKTAITDYKTAFTRAVDAIGTSKVDVVDNRYSSVCSEIDQKADNINLNVKTLQTTTNAITGEMNTIKENITSLQVGAENVQVQVKKKGISNICQNPRPRQNLTKWYASCQNSHFDIEGDAGTENLNGEVFKSGIWMSGNRVPSGQGGYCLLGNDLAGYKFNPNKKYTYDFYIYTQNYENITVQIANQDATHIVISSSEYHLEPHKYHRITGSFSPGANPDAAQFRIIFNNQYVGLEIYAFIPYINLYEGEFVFDGSIESNQGLYEGKATFDENGLKYVFEDGTWSQMGRDGFKYYKNGMEKAYQYITFTTKTDQLRNGYWTWINLPEMFRGKAIDSEFKVTVTVEDIDCNAHVSSGHYNGALRNFKAEVGYWEPGNCRIQVRCCIQKIGLTTHKIYGWDDASTDAGAVAGESAARVMIIAQM